MKIKEYPWLKLWSRKWLYGSGRMMTAEKRGVWIDLLALANEVKFRDGTLRFEVDRPMTRDYIANILQIKRETLDACLSAFQGDINTDNGQPRIKIWDDGTIFLTNFLKFQSKEGISEAKEQAIEKEASTTERSDNQELISGQSIGKAIKIAQGKLTANPRNKKACQDELDRRGIEWKVK